MLLRVTKIFKVNKGIIGLYKREYKKRSWQNFFIHLYIYQVFRYFSFMDQFRIYDAEGYIFCFSTVYDRRLWLLNDAKGRFVADNTVSCVDI